MLKRMRLKFFFVTAMIIFVMISVFCGTILISTHLRNRNFINEILERTANGIEHADAARPPVRVNFDMRAFAIKIDNENNITYYATRNYTEEEIHDCYFSGSGADSIEFYEKMTAGGKIIVGIDITIEKSAFRNLLFVTLSIGGAGLAILLVIAWFLSFWVVSPAKAALEKQQRFIADASHELRTPLTVISTGIDLLNTKRFTADAKQLIGSIKEQTEQMNIMATDLLTLSHIDERQKTKKQQFDIAHTVGKSIFLFESAAYEQGKQITYRTTGGGSLTAGGGFLYRGEPDAVKQAAVILLDNAVKHSPDGAEIEVILSKNKNRRISLSVVNECDLDGAELPFIFERFYRGEKSRTKTVGTGLGLAILKTLSEKQGWKTDAKITGGKIIFSILF